MLVNFLPRYVTGTLALILSFSLLVTPLLANTTPALTAPPQDAGTGCMDGERQAQSDVNGTTWFAIGCLAGLIGYLIAMQEPNPPATQLIGKSPEYVAAYTDCYRKKGKDIKTKNALYGCLVGYGVVGIFYAILIAAAADDDTDDDYYYY